MIRLYYWRGHGPIGSLVRHASSSPWDHVAVSVEIDGLSSYFESYPGAGTRLVPVEGDAPPEGTQDTGREWQPGQIAEVLRRLSRRRYSFWNDLLAGVGINRRSRAIQCAQATSLILQVLGIAVDEDTPGDVGEAVERITGNPVRMVR